MKLKTNRKRGFTLVEVMVTVAIFGMLSAITVPSWMRAREQAQLNSIISNLRIIESCKDRWALDHNRGTGAQPTEADLAEYLRKNAMPSPVASETYNLNPIGSAADATAASTIGNIPAGGKISIP